MQLTVTLNERVVDVVAVSLSLIAESVDEHCACLRYVTPHRRCQLAVLSADYPAWQQAQSNDDAGAATDLLKDVTLLWDRSLVWNESGSIFHWQDTMTKSVIALQLIERLRWSEDLDEVFITLEQLLLEKEFSQRFSSCLPVDPACLHASAVGKHQTL